MHAKPGLRVVLKWKIFRPDSVIATVIQFRVMLAGGLTQNGGRNHMRKLGCIGLAVILLIGAYAAFYFSSVGRHIRFYGDAEEIVNEFVVPFRTEMADDHTSIESLLSLPKYDVLKNRVIPPDRDNNEVVRFHMNEMFEIGLQADGSILWHTD